MARRRCRGAALLALPAQAADGSGSASLTIRLLAVNGTLKVVTDKAPKNRPSKGDVIEERTTLKNAVRQFGKPKGAVVGSDVGTYTFTSPTTANIELTVKLPGRHASLHLAGRPRPPRPR